MGIFPRDPGPLHSSKTEEPRRPRWTPCFSVAALARTPARSSSPSVARLRDAHPGLAVEEAGGPAEAAVGAGRRGGGREGGSGRRPAEGGSGWRPAEAAVGAGRRGGGREGGSGRLVHSVESHVKTVMALAHGKMATTGETRLLRAGIDGYLRHPQPLLSVACSPCGTVLVAGSAKGKIYMGKRKKKAVDEEDEGKKADSSEIDWVSPEPEKPVLKPNYFRYFLRGQNEKAKEGDFVIEKPKKALVSALVKNNPRSAVAVMEELVARRKLVRCFGNLDIEELGLLLEFLRRNATLPRYARFLLGVANKVVEMREEDIRSDDKLRMHIRNLKRMVGEEIQIQHTLQGIQGVISPMLALAGG
uniref:U3 small nucleolar RNA-associated protein 15 C-terminal domain-containing protein n=1 Tax=Setaria italica TaxID=4555 RepID=K3ZMJ6_SETIT